MKAVAILFYFSFDSGCCYINDPEMGSEDWPYAVLFHSRRLPISSKACWHQSQIFTHPIVLNIVKNNEIFRLLEPTCFSYPRALHSTSTNVDEINPQNPKAPLPRADL